MRTKKLANAFLVLSLLCVPAFALTEEENQKLQDETKGYEFKTVTTKEGLNFSIPEDMPIVTRNGIKAPLPFEEYLYMKFRKLEERLIATDGKVDGLDKKIDGLEKKIDELHAMFVAARKAEESKNEPSPQERSGSLSNA